MKKNLSFYPLRSFVVAESPLYFDSLYNTDFGLLFDGNKFLDVGLHKAKATRP